MPPFESAVCRSSCSFSSPGVTATFLNVMIHSISSPAYTCGSLQWTNARIFEGAEAGGISYGVWDTFLVVHKSLTSLLLIVRIPLSKSAQCSATVSRMSRMLEASTVVARSLDSRSMRRFSGSATGSGRSRLHVYCI